MPRIKTTTKKKKKEKILYKHDLFDINDSRMIRERAFRKRILVPITRTLVKKISSIIDKTQGVIE